MFAPPPVSFQAAAPGAAIAEVPGFGPKPAADLHAFLAARGAPPAGAVS